MGTSAAQYERRPADCQAGRVGTFVLCDRLLNVKGKPRLPRGNRADQPGRHLRKSSSRAGFSYASGAAIGLNQMKRTSYSMHCVLSARLGKQIVLPSRAATRLIDIADTTPRVLTYAVADVRLPYVDGRGRRDLTTIALTAQLRDGTFEQWDIGEPSKVDEDSALMIKCAYSRSRQHRYRLFAPKQLLAPTIETANRTTIRLTLFSGLRRSTDDEQDSILDCLRDRSRTIKELTYLCKLPDQIIYLATLRLWLDGRVRIPLVAQCLSPEWLIERGSHGQDATQ